MTAFSFKGKVVPEFLPLFKLNQGRLPGPGCLDFVAKRHRNNE